MILNGTYSNFNRELNETFKQKYIRIYMFKIYLYQLLFGLWMYKNITKSNVIFIEQNGMKQE